MYRISPSLLSSFPAGFLKFAQRWRSKFEKKNPTLTNEAVTKLLLQKFEGISEERRSRYALKDVATEDGPLRMAQVTNTELLKGPIKQGTPEFGAHTPAELLHYRPLCMKDVQVFASALAEQGKYSTFFTYFMKHYPEVRELHPKLTMQKISKLMGETWRTLSPEEKKAYGRSKCGTET